jgi:hypothetical protein
MPPPPPSPGSPGSPSSTHASLVVITDRVERSREEVGHLAEGLTLDQHADLITAIYEAERALRSAARALNRASRISR